MFSMFELILITPYSVANRAVNTDLTTSQYEFCVENSDVESQSPASHDTQLPMKRRSIRDARKTAKDICKHQS